MRTHRGTRRVLFVVPCSPYFPSGIVRVEQYLDRLRADGIAVRVVQYYSTTERRYAHLVHGPRRIRAALLRVPLRIALRVLGATHVAAACLGIAIRGLGVDAVVIQWVLPPTILVRWLARLPARLIYDFDDATFLQHPRRAEVLVRSAWRVVAGSHHLLRYAAERNAGAVLVPSPVAAYDYDVTANVRVPSNPATSAPCIGWIGSDGTLAQLAEAAPTLVELARNGVRFRLLIAGTRGRSDLLPPLPGVDVEEVPHYSARDLPRLVARLDIGIMPLIDDAWERGKCAMKAIIYMAGAKPVVASPVGEACHVVIDGETGYLARLPWQWSEQLRALLRDAELRKRLGAAGRARVEACYSTDVCYRTLWREVFSRI